jgi:hypothetical protein
LASTASGGKKSLDTDRAIDRIVRLVELEPEESFPEEADFTDPDNSYKLFLALENNTDGWGGWKVVDTLGLAWIEVPETLRHDLLQWRRLKGIGERLKDAENKPPR